MSYLKKEIKLFTAWAQTISKSDKKLLIDDYKKKIRVLTTRLPHNKYKKRRKK